MHGDCILYIALWQASNGRSTYADQGGGIINRIALKIPFEPARIQRHDHRVITARKMIKANLAISEAKEPVGGLLRLAVAGVTTRQFLLPDHLHVIFHPGDMSIAEQRDPVRLKRMSKVNRVQDLPLRLTRQAV